MTDQIQLSTKKQFLFSIFSILLTWMVIEVIFHLLTLVQNLKDNTTLYYYIIFNLYKNLFFHIN